MATSPRTNKSNQPAKTKEIPPVDQLKIYSEYYNILAPTRTLIVFTHEKKKTQILKVAGSALLKNPLVAK